MTGHSILILTHLPIKNKSDSYKTAKKLEIPVNDGTVVNGNFFYHTGI